MRISFYWGRLVISPIFFFTNNFYKLQPIGQLAAAERTHPSPNLCSLAVLPCLLVLHLLSAGCCCGYTYYFYSSVSFIIWTVSVLGLDSDSHDRFLRIFICLLAGFPVSFTPILLLLLLLLTLALAGTHGMI